MSLAIASLKANGKVIITKPECVNKSYPDFWKEFAKIKPNE
jgi:5-enolpyruvylshikimate-3-phosphate synthase